MDGQREVTTGSDLAAPTQTASAPAHFEPGARIRQFEIIRPLGQGGMGIVYLARDDATVPRRNTAKGSL